ncbi:MAG: hypothetical protein KJ767_01210 [Nanoarchaeota archaeon]|nr:hypothetical protein [Nanoarchaeota archaeon]
MIKNRKPLTLTETKKLLEKADSDSPKVKKTLDYLKKFVKKKSNPELVKKLNEAKIDKLKPEHIVKIADVIPETASELRSILSSEVSLDANETEKILEITKK